MMIDVSTLSDMERASLIASGRYTLLAKLVDRKTNTYRAFYIESGPTPPAKPPISAADSEALEAARQKRWRKLEERYLGTDLARTRLKELELRMEREEWTAIPDPSYNGFDPVLPGLAEDRLISISTEHISRGRKAAPQDCPLALALRDAGFSNPMVYIWRLWVNGFLTFVPPRVAMWLVSYDCGEEVKPFSFSFGGDYQEVRD